MTGFAKFIDERTIQTSEPRAFVSASGTTWYPPMPESVLREAGYLPLVDVERPEPMDGYRIESWYEVVEGVILKHFRLVAIQPAPIMISKAKVEAAVERMGKDAKFVDWLLSNPTYAGAWYRGGDSIAYDPADNESDLASLIAALGIQPEDVAALVSQVREGE